MAAIEIRAVSKRYRDGTLAVREFNLDIGDGAFMILVGPSGCGKTTLLRMIAGLEEITQGEIQIGDRVVSDLTPKQREIAMVFQNYALYPHMTVAKNMGMRAEILPIQRRLGTTIVYVTHDQTEAMTLGDRLAVMRDGVMQQVGTPDELYNRPRNVFVAGSLGDQNGGPSLGENVVRELEAASAGSSEEAPPPTSPEVIARLDSASRLGEGKEGELWLDTAKLHLFDPDSGERLQP
jgi:ABC-type sugar transport system ATPase subunit